MRAFNRTISLLWNSPQFWDAAEQEQGSGPVVRYLALLCLVAGVGTLLIGLTISRSNFASEIHQLNELGFKITVAPDVLMIGGVIASYAFLFIGTFIIAAFRHAAARMLRGQGSFAATFKATAYGLAPTVIFFFVPIANLLAPIWTYYLQYTGMQRLHRISAVRAMFVLLIGDLLPLIVIVGALFIGVLALMSGGHVSLPQTELFPH